MDHEVNIIKKEYQELAPRIDLLADVVVLAQAWKKSHTAIRRINWYADVLELDCSTIDLEPQLEKWANSIKDQSFEPDLMRLVLAPKNARWEFPDTSNSAPLNIDDFLDSEFSLSNDEPFGSWGVTQGAEQKLRPLAHLSIRDQTLATAVMLCLADAVESAQGDTSVVNNLKSQNSGVFSYGNRLHCNWDTTARPRPRARFSWGNSRIYSQYFQDYRNFLARPKNVCIELTPSLTGNRELYIVTLDLKSFFDHIDRNALIDQLKQIYKSYAEDFALPDDLLGDDRFWEAAGRILDWQWHQDDQKLSNLVNDEHELPIGLPQGLVAGGFFANAYLIGFDQLLKSVISGGGEIEGTGIKIRDYCRYVDDIRLVIETEWHATSQLEEVIENFMSELLKVHCDKIGATKPLAFNEEKTTVTPYRAISTQNNLSALMALFQETISGTFDLDALTQAAGGLDSLLWMSEQIEGPQDRIKSSLKLANIAVPNTDVRDDTVKRFVATRLASALRMRLAMTANSAVSGDERPFGDATLNHEFEATARKLIKHWSENPSLVLLLRVGLDIFPHPRLLGPVLDALQAKLYSKKYNQSADIEKKEILVAEFVSAELLRAGATETGYRSSNEYPDAIDIEQYRQDLALFARRILVERNTSPFYLKQQSMLFLASIGDYSIVSLPALIDPQLQKHLLLHKVLLYSSCSGKELENALPLALVGQQLAPNPPRFSAWLAESLKATSDPFIVGKCINHVVLNRPDLMQLVLKNRLARSVQWREFVPDLLISTRKHDVRKLHLKNNEYIPLEKFFSRNFNEFSQENALLLLAHALLLEPDIETKLAGGLHIGNIKINCEDWSILQSLPEQDGFLKVELDTESDAQFHLLYDNPPWVDNQFAWLYGFGRILRSCITGEYDFTTRHYLVTEEVSRYTGWRSTWFKRRFGLLNTNRSLLDEPAPISPWLTGLLSILLQWPGMHVGRANSDRFSKLNSRSDILDLIVNRINEQRKLYGKQSSTPMYVIPTQEFQTPVKRPMRIAVVQPMLPRREQFNDKEPCRWSKSLMAEHRRHLAEVCRLTHQKLKTWSTAQKLSGACLDSDEPLVDLILFPELSVHPEHVSHLRTLSDKVGATIFAGLTFIESPKHTAPINQGLWLIRTVTPGRGRTFQYVWQGKQHLTELEKKLKIKSYRPYQVLVEFPIGSNSATRVAAAICYDATDLALVADLRDRSDLFLVAALNQDVQTFDNMVAALHFHMYQPVILANMGEFGGSTAQAPFSKHDRLIAHVHGNEQVAVSLFEIDPEQFKINKKSKSVKETKTPPAGYKGRP